MKNFPTGPFDFKEAANTNTGGQSHVYENMHLSRPGDGYEWRRVHTKN